MKDIAKISAEMEISVLDIKLALGIPLALCTAGTRDAAWDAFEEAEHDSEEEVAAIQQYLELCTTVGQVKKALANFGSETTLERICFARLNELLAEKAAAATTVTEAQLVYASCPINGPAADVAIRKIYELFPE